MRPEDLYDAFHEIDDDLLKPLPEAAPRRHPALRWGALAPAPAGAGGLLWLHRGKMPRRSRLLPSPRWRVSRQQANRRLPGEPSHSRSLQSLSTARSFLPPLPTIAYPEGYFIRTLSGAQLASIWGQETLWLTDAENEVI